MISALAWVPKGAAAPNPKRYQMSVTEIAMLQQQAENMENAIESDSDNEHNPNAVVDGDFPEVDISELPADLRMDEYSDDEVGDETVGNLIVGGESEMVGTHVGEDGVPMEPDNDSEEEEEEEEEEDKNKNNNIEKNEELNDSDSDSDSDSDLSMDDYTPLEDTREYTPIDVKGLEAMGLTKNNGGNYFGNDEDNEEDSDEEDTNILSTDALCVVATTDEDFSALEVYCYETKTGNLYVHHDIALPAFPLSVAWGDINEDGTAGNYAAVGTFDKGIEVWNLDVLDALEPSFILGGEKAQGELFTSGASEAAVHCDRSKTSFFIL